MRPLLAFLALAACGTSDDATDEPPTPGAADLGDPLFPGLGNGGYTVDHYQLDLRYGAAAEPIDGTVIITATARQALSQLDLDFAGESVGDIEVDGAAAAARREDSELVITPAQPIASGAQFTIVVEHVVATPSVASADVLLGAPFFVTQDGSAWAFQPDNAHLVFPCNDHPSNKATFTFNLDVPAGVNAYANGVRVGRDDAGDRTIWHYEQREPMATELAQVVVGAFTETVRGTHAGAHVRDVTPSRLTDTLAPTLAIELEHLDWLTERLGPYPFTSYGTLVVDASLGFALETQTLSLFQASYFAKDVGSAPVMVHELAHQWLGDSVAPARWADVWLNEAHASWYEVTWQTGDDAPALTDVMHQIYTDSAQLRFDFGPVAAPPSGAPRALFNRNVYRGGMLALFALRQQIGAAAFKAVEQAWVDTYRGGAASTADFIALASRVSGQDLSAFLHDWLYGASTPPMPGHPDWVARPPTTTPARAATAAASSGPARAR